MTPPTDPGTQPPAAPAQPLTVSPPPKPEPDPMPVFVLKAKDRLAGPAILAYLNQCWDEGLNDQAAEVRKALNEFSAWQHRHPDAVKLPDHRHVDAASSHPAAVLQLLHEIRVERDAWRARCGELRDALDRCRTELAATRREHTALRRALGELVRQSGGTVDLLDVEALLTVGPTQPGVQSAPASDVDRIAQAIGDPGSLLRRIDGETVTRWSTRAVLQVLARDADIAGLVGCATHELLAALTAERDSFRSAWRAAAEDYTRACADLTRERAACESIAEQHLAVLGDVARVARERNAMRLVVEAVAPLAEGARVSTAPRTETFQRLLDAYDAYLAGRAEAVEVPATPVTNEEIEALSRLDLAKALTRIRG